MLKRQAKVCEQSFLTDPENLNEKEVLIDKQQYI